MTGIAVVVPTFRRSDGLRRVVEALDRQTLDRRSWELVIVDDSSGPPWSDEADAIALQSRGPTRIIHLPVNRGPARARNAGWRSSDATLIAFTDDDCEPSPDWLATGVAELERSPCIGIVQGATLRPPGSETYPYSCFTVVREVLEPSPWFEGCNLFLRRQALEAAGGFDETMGVHGEDTALGWSVLDAGWERGWVPSAAVIHELAERPWRWHLRIHYLEGRLVHLSARHPEMRKWFWKPWAVKRENALFALAAAGVGLCALSFRRRTWPLVLALPYITWLFTPWRRPMSAQAAAHQISVHGASLLGKAVAGVRERTFLL